MNGFERSLQQSILDFMPQAVITTGNGVLDPQTHPVSQLAGLRDVVKPPRLSPVMWYCRAPAMWDRLRDRN